MPFDDKTQRAPHPLEPILEAHENWLAQRVAQGKSGALALALVQSETGEQARVVHLYAPDPRHVPENNLYVGKTLSDQEMCEVLASHKQWLGSEGTAGRRARLMSTNLRCLPSTSAAPGQAREELVLKWAHLHEANLSQRDLSAAKFDGAWLDGAILSEANLRNAVFRDASLKGADLSDADITGASFAGAELGNASFHRAKGLRSLALRGVDLSQTRGIPASAFARRDTTGSRLPDELLQGLAPVSDASRNARTVFQVMLLACLYCWLSLLSVTDQQVITNVGRIVLPILDIEITLRSFFFFAPALLLLSLVYLHLYLRHVWEGAARLPARFPDGTTVGERTSPWLMTALIDRYPALEQRTTRPARVSLIVRGQEWIGLALGFWSVPATVAFFAGRYLTRQSLIETCAYAVLVWLSIMLAAGFQISMISTLRAAPEVEGAPVSAARTQAAALAMSLLLAAATYYLAMTDAGLSLSAPDLPSAPPPASDGAQNAAVLGDEVWESAKLDFVDRSLVGAHGERAYLKNANLERANLSLADLRRAKLSSANLQHASLRRAILTRADLSKARLNGADLSGADLRDATGLTQAMLADACGDNTQLPAGLNVRPCTTARGKSSTP